jgi:hypothetical protein
MAAEIEKGAARREKENGQQSDMDGSRNPATAAADVGGPGSNGHGQLQTPDNGEDVALRTRGVSGAKLNALSSSSSSTAAISLIKDRTSKNAQGNEVDISKRSGGGDGVLRHGGNDNDLRHRDDASSRNYAHKDDPYSDDDLAEDGGRTTKFRAVNNNGHVRVDAERNGENERDNDVKGQSTDANYDYESTTDKYDDVTVGGDDKDEYDDDYDDDSDSGSNDYEH